jgi:hypothetical protein
VKSPCEHSTEPSGSIKCWEEELSSMELVSLFVCLFVSNKNIQHSKIKAH